MKNWSLGFLAAAGLAVSMAGPSVAADYPTKPVTIIVGFAAGGGTDAVVRATAEPLGTAIGQTVIVQNKPGAGGGVAAMTIKASEPDGYTLIATGTLTYTFEPQMLKTQYKFGDFEHVAVVGLFQDGLFTHPSRPYKSMRDVINAAKAEKRDIKYASQYALDRLIFEYVSKKEGVKFIPVPTQGGNGTVQAVLANQVDFGFSGGTFGPYAKSGQLRVIGAMSLERMERFPDILSLRDNGWEVGGENYIVFSAPKGTPKAVVDKLAKGFQEAAKSTAVNNVIDTRYMKNVYMGPAETEKMISNGVKKYADLIAKAK